MYHHYSPFNFFFCLSVILVKVEKYCHANSECESLFFPLF